MIRRQKSMRFLGGFYVFPGGKVDPEDGARDILDRCRGITEAEAGEPQLRTQRPRLRKVLWRRLFRNGIPSRSCGLPKRQATL
jgi:hypothetical protein